jgi:hypothetical protein
VGNKKNKQADSAIVAIREQQEETDSAYEAIGMIHPS